MDKSTPSHQTIQAAADAVVEFTLISFEPRFLLWEKMVNLEVAERVWNAQAVGVDPLSAGSFCEPEFAELTRTLTRARSRRWAAAEFLIFGLDLRHEGGEILVTFDLTWDNGENFHSCEIAVDFLSAFPRGPQSTASPKLN